MSVSRLLLLSYRNSHIFSRRLAAPVAGGTGNDRRSGTSRCARGCPLIHEENADGTNNFHSVYMRIKVLTEAGRKYADVEIPYSRRGFSISGISGRTIHADGSIVPFQGKPFDKVLAKGRNVHYQVKSFALPDVQVGSIMECRYDLRYGDHSALAPIWLVQNELFQKRSNSSSPRTAVT
jgi:Domain of Unknown Function with PDB structure (DUF3857)